MKWECFKSLPVLIPNTKQCCRVCLTLTLSCTSGHGVKGRRHTQDTRTCTVFMHIQTRTNANSSIQPPAYCWPPYWKKTVSNRESTAWPGNIHFVSRAIICDITHQPWQTVTAWDIQDWHSVSNMTEKWTWVKDGGSGWGRERIRSKQPNSSRASGGGSTRRWSGHKSRRRLLLSEGRNHSCMDMMCSSEGCVAKIMMHWKHSRRRSPHRLLISFHFNSERSMKETCGEVATSRKLTCGSTSFSRYADHISIFAC